jgi:hypothetical protein
MTARFSRTAAVTGALLIAAVPLTELVAGKFFLLTPLALLLLLVAVPWLQSTVPGGGDHAGALGASAVVSGPTS